MQKDDMAAFRCDCLPCLQQKPKPRNLFRAKWFQMSDIILLVTLFALCVVLISLQS
jgi:hypothetical protein